MSEQSWIKFVCPPDMRKRFKMLCWAQNTSMTDKLLEYVDEQIKANSNLIREVENLEKGNS
jgi:hypothetical protein